MALNRTVMEDTRDDLIQNELKKTKMGREEEYERKMNVEHDKYEVTDDTVYK